MSNTFWDLARAASGDSPAPVECGSLPELAERFREPAFAPIRALFDVRSEHAVPLCMTAEGLATAQQAMRCGERELVEQQVIIVRDRLVGRESLYNPLRARRFAAVPDPSPAATTPSDAPAANCAWCTYWGVTADDPWTDPWGTVRSDDGRVASRANWARQAQVSGVVFGDSAMHRVEGLSAQEFVMLFDVAEGYLRRALEWHVRPLRFCMISMNSNARAGASVPHSHLQCVARHDRHFQFAEQRAGRRARDYWHRTYAAHRTLGLAGTEGNCLWWASLVPAKERDVTVLSRTVGEGARQIHRMVQRLHSHGTRSFGLAAILSPAYFGRAAVPARFRLWPEVVWKLVDRGDPGTPHSDIGTMEFFASTVFATDPFDVARWIGT